MTFLFINQLNQAAANGINWAITLGIGVAALGLAVSLIAWVYSR